MGQKNKKKQTKAQKAKQIKKNLDKSDPIPYNKNQTRKQKKKGRNRAVF